MSEARIPNMDSLVSCSPNALSFVTVDEELVYKLLSSVNITKACGCDGISNKVIKLCAEELCNSFTNLINTSLRLGQYPSAWKLANFLPLFKKDDRHLKTNYRPVSLLSCLSKICEKVVFIHLYSFLDTIGFFYRFQSGFRPGDSTVMQLVYIVHEMYEVLEKGIEIRVVFLDISKAFDRVWHRDLLVKLRSIGLEGNMMNWFASHLSNRKQRVVIEGVHSDWRNIVESVPQGSVLGPFYINNLPTSVNSNCKLLFICGRFLLIVVHSPSVCASRLNHDLASISTCANRWLVLKA